MNIISEISGKVLHPAIACVVIGILGASILIYSRVQNNEIISFAENTTQLVGESVAKEIETIVNFGKVSIKSVADTVSTNMMSATLENPSKTILPLVAMTPFQSIEYIRPDGMNIMNIGKPFDASDRIYFREGIKGRLGIWNNYHPKIARETLLNFYSPIYHEGSISGVITGYISPRQTIIPRMEHSFFNEKLHMLLYDSKGMVIAAYPSVEFRNDMTLSDYLKTHGESDSQIARIIEILSQETPKPVGLAGHEGELRLFVKNIEGTDWRISTLLTSHAFSAITERSLHNTYLISGLVAFLALAYISLVIWKSRRERKKFAEQNLHLGRLVSTLSSDYSTLGLLNENDKSFEFIAVDHNINRLLGFEKGMKLSFEELVEVYINSAVAPEDHQKVISALNSVLLLRDKRNDRIVRQKFRMVACNEDHYYQLKCQRVKGTLYTIMGLMNIDALVQEEVSRTQELKNLNDELSKAKQSAESASRAKSIFLSSMSHDIRTPMNAILGFTRLMKKSGDPEILVDYLEKIEKAGEYLLEVINNVLDMSRIESGKMELALDCMDLSDEDYYSFDMFSNDIARKKLHISRNIQITNRHILGDVIHLRQIFVNLVSNAIKYTPENGSIHVEVYERPCNRVGYSNYTFMISDTGIGMSEDFQKHIFDSFSREHTTTESKVIGTGLGMAIVKKLVDLMEGTIKVESEIGKGSTFTVTTPLKLVDSPEEFTRKVHNSNFASTKHQGRILLAEDNDLNAEIAIALLSETGIQIDRAADGLECMDMILKADAGYYDLILMDIQMPNMDGYQATKEIRSFADKAKADIPIFAMTANAFEEDKKAALENGMNGHIGKPINVEQLMGMIGEIIK